MEREEDRIFKPPDHPVFRPPLTLLVVLSQPVQARAAIYPRTGPQTAQRYGGRFADCAGATGSEDDPGEFPLAEARQ